jgi:hypothetical protein
MSRPYIYSATARRAHLARRFTWAISYCGPRLGFCLSSPRLQYLQSDREKVFNYGFSPRYEMGDRYVA